MNLINKIAAKLSLLINGDAVLERYTEMRAELDKNRALNALLSNQRMDTRNTLRGEVEIGSGEVRVRVKRNPQYQQTVENESTELEVILDKKVIGDRYSYEVKSTTEMRRLEPRYAATLANIAKVAEQKDAARREKMDESIRSTVNSLYARDLLVMRAQGFSEEEVERVLGALVEETKKNGCGEHGCFYRFSNLARAKRDRRLSRG
jgi:hypothetical protein